jgi:hypothetical protein
MKNLTFELKYCERCGSLGLRRSQSPETYCRPCGQLMLNYSVAGDAGYRSLIGPNAAPAAPLVLKSAAEATMPGWRLP